MAIPTDAMMQELFKYGTSVQMMTATKLARVSLSDFLRMPEPGERDPWLGRFYFSPEPYDDGGGAALAAYRFGRCPFVTK